MKISFHTKKDESEFKKFVCKNKKVLKTFLGFGMLMKNPLLKLIFEALSKGLDIICPD